MKKIHLIICLALILIPSVINAAAWQLSKDMWSEEDEKVYSKFVEALCDSKYSNLNKFIRDSKANPLYGKEDNDFDLRPDCADLPYLLRSYVAYKLRLPFRYTSNITCNGGDQRYSKGNKPIEYKSQNDFKSPQQLFYKVLLVNSGYYRINVDSDLSDHYSVKVSKKTIIPGTVYYDPNGHVALVGKITENGRIRMIDAHPDKTISKPWFGAKFNKGMKINGGGFKKWRPILVLSNGSVVSTNNHNIMDYSGNDQFKTTYTLGGRSGYNYHDYVRAVVAKMRETDPVKEFVFLMRELYEDIVYRAMAVDLALNKKIDRQSHPGALPWNIYGTDGLWETYSTPSRDARLKVAFKEFYDNTRRNVLSLASIDYNGAKKVAAAMVMQYDNLSNQCSIYYTNSIGRQIKVTFDDVLTRLFDLSFDPYHSAELRWGAKGDELASAKDDDLKKRFYKLEAKLRNNLERVYGMPTPLTFGPDNPPDFNIRNWLVAFAKGKNADKTIEFKPNVYERVAANPDYLMPAPVATPFVEPSKSNIELKPAVKKAEKVDMQIAQTPKVVVNSEISQAAKVVSNIVDIDSKKDNKIKNNVAVLKKTTAASETLSWFNSVKSFADAVSDSNRYTSE